MKEIELGDKVECVYSGFVGIVTSKTEFINGCVQFGVIPKHQKSKGFIPPEAVDMDSQSLRIIKKGKKKIIKKIEEDDEEEESNGGPMRKSHKLRGY